MNPCTSFWDDLPELAKRSPEAFLPETPWLNEQGPALLGLWGKGQRDYLSMLRELETSPDLKVNLGEVSLPPEGERQGVLQDLQTAIGKRGVFPGSSSGSHPSDLKLSQTDSSIEVHSCQTITHQLLVLRECLLRRGAGGAELKLSDCMVLCADLELARPAIHHVFGVAQQGGRFAYRITRSPAQRSALASLLLDILNGSQTQFSLEQLAQWLSQTLYLSLTRLEPDEAQNFLSALDDVGFVSNLSVKQGFEASFERLLLGAAMDMPLGRASFGRSPSARDTIGQDVLGRRAFAKLSLLELNRFERVLTLINSIETLRTGQALFLDWVVKLDAWLAEWIEPVEQAPELETLSEDLIEFRAVLARAAQTYPSAEQGLEIDATVFRQCLIEALEGARAPGQLAGALNFVQLGAGLIPPTQLIAVLGMNQNLWPRQSFKDELDLTQAWIRSGDLSGYYQDRAELLDALMAARQGFLVFYQGLDPSDSNALSPSSQIAELLTTLGVKPIQHVMPIPGSAQRILRLKASEYENLVSSYTERQARMQAETHEGLKPETQARPARKVIRLREMVDALLDPSKLLLRSWSALLIERPVLAEHEPLDQGVLGDPEGGSQAWFAMEVATRMITGEMTESVAAAAFSNHPIFADGPVAMTMAETSLTLATSLVTKVRRSSVASALPFESRQVVFRLGGFEIQDHVMLGREAKGDAMHLVLGRGSLTPNLLVRGYLAHCLVNAVLGPANTSFVCLGKAGETLLASFDSRSEARAALQAWLDFLEEGLRDPKLFDATSWLKECLLANKSRNESPKTGESSEEDSDADLAFVLTRSAELLWKESLPNPSVMEQRAGRLIEQIRQRLEPSSE
jgi:exonuclease V gamma subunit